MGAMRDWRDLRRGLAGVVAALLTALALPAASAAGDGGIWLVDVGGVDLDTVLRPQSLVLEADTEPAPTDEIPPAGETEPEPAVEPAPAVEVDAAVRAVGAPAVWGATTGERAVVALIDTGVAPVPSLEGAVAGEIDFTGTGGGDGYGHGTFMASLIAGRPTAEHAGVGVAPGAGILSLKVADATGGASLGAVLSALQWLHGPGRAGGIRVATLAFAVDAGTPAADLLDRAVDRLAHVGVLVVTATGNGGAGTLGSPATATRSLSVGAAEAAGIAAAFSGSGPDRDGVLQPDVRAPGVDVVGSLPPASVIAQSAAPLAGATALYRGSGTSMATALTAGVAALLHSARLDLDGAALRRALRAGSGDLDAVAAAQAAAAEPAGPGATSSGTLPAAVDVVTGLPIDTGTVLDPASIRWTSIRWTSIRWTGAGWGDGTSPIGAWGSIRWTGTHWAYSGPSPQSIRWTSIRWTSIRWTTGPW